MNTLTAITLAILAQLVANRSCLSASINYSGEACEGLSFELACPRGYVILTWHVFYGRKDPERCVDATQEADDLDLTCAAADALEVIQTRCDDRQSCSIQVGAEVFGDPCPGTSKYMEMKFNCTEPVHTAVQCEGSQLSIQCPPGAFISSEISTFYGRHSNDICYHDAAITSTNCTSTRAPEEILKLCRMKEKCDIYVRRSVLGDPCPGNYKYLQVNYTCSVCANEHPNEEECEKWKSSGECEENPGWMMAFCKRSCTQCDVAVACSNSHSEDAECDYWASVGECSNNPDFMNAYCRKSCNTCPALREDYSVNPGPTASATNGTHYLTGQGYGIKSQTVCEGDKKAFTCPDGTYIRIYNATFGRRSNATCTADREDDVSNTQCHSYPDVLTKFQKTCTGRGSCTGSAYNDALGDPCPGTYKYLEISYTCQECRNVESDTWCDSLASQGDCKSNPGWMYDNCFKSCSKCQYSSCGNALGEDDSCDYWALRGECNLNPNWMARNCRESCRGCPAEDSRCDPDCGPHGTCVTTNTCRCESGYSGIQCSQFDCSRVSNCSGHGTCGGPDLCQCDPGWTGLECSEFSCAGRAECNRHGQCIGPDQCLCYPYWTGESCSSCLFGFDPAASCLPCPNCDHGTCLQSGSMTISYKGCYKDSDVDPDFTFIAWKSSPTTTISCIQRCHAHNYTYAATTAGTSCRCGNSYGSHGVSTSCDISCADRQPGEICGGMDAYSVWLTQQGHCRCDGPNWTGRLCDRCASGYAGDRCQPVGIGSGPTTSGSYTTSKATPSFNTTFTDTTLPMGSHYTTSPRTTTSVLEGSRTSKTSGQPNTNSSDGLSRINPDSGKSRAIDSSLGGTTDISFTTSSIQSTQESQIIMTLSVDKQWRDVYNDTTEEETESLMKWLTNKLMNYYERKLDIDIVRVVVNRLRPGSICVEHVIVTSDVNTFAEKRAVQCDVIRRLSEDNGQVDPELRAYPEQELVKNCAVEGLYCLNGATPGFDQYGLWTCRCPSRYSGARCENTVKDKAVIIVIIIVSVSVPLALILSLCFIIPRYKRKVKGSYGGRDADDSALSNVQTARSFEFHSMSRSVAIIHARKLVNQPFYDQDTVAAGEDNEAYTGSEYGNSYQ